MTTKLYDDVLMEHIRNARNYCVLQDPDREASGTNPLCGDDMTIYIRLAGDRVQQVAFQCTCCGVSMASASMMTEAVSGMPALEVLENVRAFAALLSGSEVPTTGDVNRRALLDTVRRFPARLRCALLPWLTLEAALLGREHARFTS